MMMIVIVMMIASYTNDDDSHHDDDNRHHDDDCIVHSSTIYDAANFVPDGRTDEQGDSRSRICCRPKCNFSSSELFILPSLTFLVVGFYTGIAIYFYKQGV